MLTIVLIGLIKALHTAVFFVVAGCIGYALRGGLTGRGSRPLLIGCLLFPTLIGGMWLLNGRECILSTAIYALAGGDRTTPDIYLPLWLAEWIMTGSTLLLVTAAALVLARAVTRRWQPE